MTKSDLIKLMNSLSFDWICDIAIFSGNEMVASKINDCDQLWWRTIEVEGSGFTSLFKGSIHRVFLNEKNK